MIRFLFFIIALLSSGCIDTAKPGKEIAKKYCSSCHLFPEPSLLDKITWQKSVLPAMGKLLGAQQLEQHPFEESDRILSHQQSYIPAEEWRALTNFYVDAAPAKLPSQSRGFIKQVSNWFTVEKNFSKSHPKNTFLKIDPGNRWIYAATADSLLQVFDHKLNNLNAQHIEGVLVDMHFANDLNNAGKREGICTNIGIMDPNDLKTGSASLFTIDKEGQFLSKKVFDTLSRPVQVVACNLNGDSMADFLVCGFGNKEGNFTWITEESDGQFTRRIFESLPGSIRAYIEDMNGDGLQDIIVLFAQADEGIRLYLNKGNGRFDKIDIMRFQPVFGSTYFEMVDLDGDGRKDILYTCGDNADYSNILKNYHGVYIFLNKGGYKYEQAYFFPMHGAFKAMAKDFNNDGRLDIAAISYFPDRKNQPEESIVILERLEGFNFSPRIIKEHSEGHWITMDADDVDGDGDVDIVVGSLILGDVRHEVPKKPLFLLLRNKAIK